MEPSTSSCFAVIPEKKLKIWNIFRDVGNSGEEILKTAKLAHVANAKEGFVVTITDETYSFIRKDPGPSGCKISKILELSGIRVKEFITSEINFALTEDGRLFSWSSELGRHGEEYYVGHDQDIVNQLGRFVSCQAADKLTLFRRPAEVTEGSSTGVRVRQVTLPGRKKTYTVALSEDGNVHQWGATRGWGRIRVDWVPSLIPKEHFDCQEIIAVTSSDHMGVALTARGEITGSFDLIFALTVRGEMYYLEVDVPSFCADVRRAEWKTDFGHHKIEDIASCAWAENVVVVELKNNTRFAFSYYEQDNRKPPSIPIFTFPSGESIDELFAKHGDTCYRTISAQIEPPPRPRVSDDICDLWQNKEHADVKFSMEGKVIPAHKCILAGRSEYFKIMFSQEWNEAKGEGSVIEVKDTKHDIFEALLFYFYSDKIKFAEDEYANIFDLMKLADFYCETYIHEECEKILISNINAANAFFLARNASSANALTLEGKAIKFIADNQLLVANSSPEEMIDLVGMEAFRKISVALLHQ